MNRSIAFLCVLFYAIVSPLFCSSQSTSDSLPQKKNPVSFAGMALPARSPENGFYVQGGLIGLFKTDPKDSLLRTSNLYLFGLYSQLRQYRISLGGDVFTKKEKYYFNGWYYYSYLPEAYFGTGEHVSPDKSEFISYRLWYLNTNALRNIYKKWFAGLTYSYEHLYNLTTPQGGIAETQRPTGMETYSVSGLGLRVRHDSRDYIISSTKGFFFDINYNAFGKVLGSTYTFNQFALDLRKFINLTPKKYNVLAFNFVMENVNGKVPFRYLSYINARGYHPNLYRDNTLLSLQAEYRLRIWKWIGASFFGGISETAPSVNQLAYNPIRENYGGGLRFRVIKQHNMYLRVEYGMSHNTSNYYVSFYDAF
ncbi:MAG TPA: BamA/TamA family outer membrane protein [Cytophagaceae bacterium]|nr:BamA/TamA family outer membrane protein [Cytophagaceae bacterium]